MRVPSADQAGARSSRRLWVTCVSALPSGLMVQISDDVGVSGLSPTLLLVNTIFCPSLLQSGSTSIFVGSFVMFVGGTPARRSHTLATKMSLSAAGAPGWG